MKKAYFTLILLVSIFSCKKEDAREHMDSETYNSKLRALTTDVGIVHNKALNFFLKNSKTLIVDHKTIGWRLGNGSTISNNNSMPNQVLLNSVNYLNSTTNSYADLDPVAAQKLDVLMENLNLTSIEAAWNSEISAVTSENLLTFREANMVAELKDIFSNAYSLNLTQVAASAYFKDRLEQIQIKYQNTIFEANEGELYLGLLSLAQSSNEYWHNPQNTSSITPYDPNDPEFPIVQLDLIGYIIGWGRAVLDDYRKGNLNSAGQYVRIGKGIEYGTAASFAAWLKKITLVVPEVGPIGGPDPNPNPNPNPNPQLPTGPTSELCYVSANIPVAVSNPESTYFQVRIFLNNNDMKYYVDSGLPYLANGYHIFVSEYTSGRYVNIVDGVIVGTGFALIDPFN